MPDGLLEIAVAVLVRGMAFGDEVRPLADVAAAALAAVLASYLSWHLTDRVVAWRRRADQDER